MSVENSINDTTEAIVAALSKHDLSSEEKAKILQHVSRLLMETVEETTESHIAAATGCCGPELDLAHQIRAEINRQTEILINNLKALR